MYASWLIVVFSSFFDIMYFVLIYQKEYPSSVISAELGLLIVMCLVSVLMVVLHSQNLDADTTRAVGDTTVNYYHCC